MNLTETRQLTDQFTEEEGRRPRLLLVALGAGEDERSLRLYAAAFADSGYDVDVGPLRQSPHDAARMAAENDVHIIGLCGLQDDEAPLIQELCLELSAQGREDIPAFVRTPNTWATDSLSIKTLHNFPAEGGDYHAEASCIIQKLISYYELA